MLTQASTKGFESHSFHQNRLSTRRQRGSMGLGSLIGLTLVPSTSDTSDAEISESGEGRALRSARRACCFCDLAIWSCLCCSERVISVIDRVFSPTK